MLQDIDNHISIINESLAWARDFKKDSFPSEQFKEYRRKLSKIRKALSANCSAAAYGESQVGKSYLMSSLLSASDHPFVIESNGKEYSFIDDLNPSGGNNTKIESTGVITRFTVRRNERMAKNQIKILNLSVVDLILLLADSYYNDIKIDLDTALSFEAINKELEMMSALWENKSIRHDIITEDDIKDINDYIKEVIGNNAAAIYQSNFCKTIAPVIQYVAPERWINLFSLLWNRNPEINRLFDTLINAYRKLDFRQEVYVPFDAVLRDKGTLLKIEWLDTVCGVSINTRPDEIYTDVYDVAGNKIAENFSKGELSALIAELTFELPQQIASDRKFLNHMDLLDFPGARSREKYKEREIASVLPKMLRRGKVAYLFNKYSRSLQIGSVLFCHHNDQKAEPSIGETINNWIEENIGRDPEERSKMLGLTNGIAPLFLIATKFNIDLERTKTDRHDNPESLDKHWNRFDTVLPEIIKPNTWLDKWCLTSGGTLSPFRNIYPLRDFFWSGKNGLFDGYSDGMVKSPEKAVHKYVDYPDYLERLKESFLRHSFVTRHFADPAATWSEVATINNDGSKAIIRDLDIIAPVLDSARKKRYHSQLERLKREVISSLQVFYEPEDRESKNKKVKLIASDIRKSLEQTVANNPAMFGRILDTLMIDPLDLRNIAYEIIACHTDTPKDFSALNFIRARAAIDISDSREANIQRLLTYYFIDSEEVLKAHLERQGYSLEEVISKEIFTLSSIGDVIAKHIVEYWVEHLNTSAQSLAESLPHADEVVFMLVNLFGKLGVEKKMSEEITRYTTLFPRQEQPNVIADYSALILNKFVSNVGRHYMSDKVIDELKRKAQDCQLPVDFSPAGWDKVRKPQPLIETLKAFDEAATVINRGLIDMDVLLQLPFCRNYMRWENFVFIGLIYSSDISHYDPKCNGIVKALIERAEPLYNA